MPVNIVVTGVLGRMGRIVAEVVLGDGEARLVGCTEAPGHSEIGTDVGVKLGRGPLGVAIGGDLANLATRDCVVIDFSSPQATMAHLEVCARAGARIVVGTTGLDNGQIERLRAHARTIPVLFSPNMSLGVNLLFWLTEQVSAKVGLRFDIEIIEAHHRHKVDSPSGTAKRLGEIAATALGLNSESAIQNGRSGLVGERPHGQIGMHAVRGGDIVGDHTVLFAGTGERLELRHVAHNRTTFAQGAVAGARWLSTREPGLYSMRDVLGL